MAGWQRRSGGDFICRRVGLKNLNVALQMANTIRESVSEITVAPNVMETGSSRVSPNRTIIGAARSVCEASNDPKTIAAMG